MFGLSDLVLSDLLAVQGMPGVSDVGEDEGDEETDPEHGAKSEGRARGVLYGE